MTCITDINSKRHLPAKLVAALALSTVLIFGPLVGSAKAEEHGGHHGYHHHGYGGWHGRYYPAPPVVYGSPYYYPPPVIYGPGIGISLPFISIGVQ